MVDDDIRDAYREAYDYWQIHLERLHALLLDGERPERPDQIKGLLNRESRAKEQYEEVRRKLLGLDP